MTQRYPTDLSHFSISVMDIGGLQTLTNIPVVANDGIEMDLSGVFRLSPLRRNLIVDVMLELFAFYVPHRHVYGDDWITFVKDGPSEAVTFTGVTASARVSYLGSEIASTETIPTWLCAGYNRIWNRYFRSPDDANAVADTYISNNNTELLTGFRTGYLPVPWSTGTVNEVASTEREVSSATVVDIADFNRVQASYRAEVDRQYFGQRYNDILGVEFGSRVNTDADERPTLLAHTKQWISGYDVDGTGDASLGTYSGKSAGVGHIGFPRRVFPEHGSIYVMAVARFPTIHVNERPYLHTVSNPTWLEISGHPDLVAAEPPRAYNADEFFRSSSASSLGFMPYGQHYRYQPSVVHRQYELLDGFSFVDSQIDTIPEAHYISTSEYDEVFQTTQLRQMQSHVKLNVNAMRVVPPARHSLYAGG